MHIGQSVLVADPTGNEAPYFGEVFWFESEKPLVDVIDFSGIIRKVPLDWCLLGTLVRAKDAVTH